MRTTLAGVVLSALLPLTASAQTAAEATEPDATQPPPASQGPMIVERIHNGFLIAPEAKSTRFDK